MSVRRSVGVHNIHLINVRVKVLGFENTRCLLVAVHAPPPRLVPCGGGVGIYRKLCVQCSSAQITGAVICPCALIYFQQKKVILASSGMWLYR